MKKFMPIFCFGSIAALSCVLPATVSWADVKAGVDAWSDGDYNTAIKVWEPLAARGDADAEFNLGQAYKLGRGVPMNLEKAKDLFGKAAAQGHIQAADLYGLMLFQDGEREKAMPYIKASAARGDPRAQYILGVACFNGDLAEKNWVRAYALVTLAQQAGLPQAAHALAQMDQHIPLADRQKSVILSTQLAADAQATRERMAAAAELGAPAQPTSPTPHIASAPSIAAAQQNLPAAGRVAESDSPASAGADYTHAAPPPGMVSQPRPAPSLAATTAVPPKPTPIKARAPAPQPPTPAPAETSGPWRVQLGAFGVAGNADKLWARVHNRPELAGHGKMLVPAGRLTKLLAGGFPSKAAADAACSRLAASGFACLAVQD